MKKIEIGDVFEIETRKGKAFFQYIFDADAIGELVRILPGLCCKQPEELVTLVNSQELFLIHFPVKAALGRKIIKFIGNFPLPANFRLPTFFRADFRDRDGNLLYWHIVDYNTWKRKKVDELNSEQKKLSPWGIWNDTLLIERLEQGWTLEKWS